MSTRPPRRRREPARGPNNVRTVLLGLVVIVAGLGIGMLSAVLMHRGSNTTASLPAAPRVTPVAAPASSEPARVSQQTPQPRATFGRPVAVATPLATPSPSPRTPAPAPSPSHTPAPAAKAKPSATPEPAPSASPTQRVTPRPAPLAAASPARPATPVAISTGFDIDIAQAVVRRYLDAIARGDNATARALLGASPTDVNVPLPELSFINTSTKIGSLAGRRTGDASAAVEVQVTNGAQRYGIVYEVVQNAKGTLISGRDITRP